MGKHGELTKEDQNHQGIIEAPNSPSTEIQFGAPSGPRRPRNEKYDGHQPLEYPGFEAVAQHLATPKSLREYISDSDLAKHFHVSRMTIHRAKKDIDVIKRAHWLSMRNKLAGDLVVRREYPSIMEKAAEIAEEGNVKAMEFCAKQAWPGDQELKDSLSLEFLIATSDDEYIPPSHIMKKIEDRQAAEREATDKSRPPEESKDKTE